MFRSFSFVASIYTALMIVNYINSAVKSLAIGVGWRILARSRSIDVDKGLTRAKFPRCDEESKVNQLRLVLIVPSICREEKESDCMLSWAWYNVGRISPWTVNASSSGGLCAPSTFASVRLLLLSISIQLVFSLTIPCLYHEHVRIFY